jgi:hypothetical protein
LGTQGVHECAGRRERRVTWPGALPTVAADINIPGDPMAGSYELSKNPKGQFSFVLKAGNGEVILRSEQYESKASALNGILSVQTNSPLDERFDRKQASDGRPYFNLKAGNHQIIGTSQMYASVASRDNGILSVQMNGASTAMKDNT